MLRLGGTINATCARVPLRSPRGACARSKGYATMGGVSAVLRAGVRYPYRHYA